MGYDAYQFSLIESNLYHSDDIESALCEEIYNFLSPNKSVELCRPLCEAISYDDNLSSYIPLIEAVEDIKDITEEVKDINDEKDPEKKATFIDKAVKKLKSLYEWWYKVDPNKKYATLRIVLRALITILGLVLTITRPGAQELAVALTYKLAGDKLKSVKNLKKKVINKTFKKSIVVASNVVGIIYGVIAVVLSRLDTTLWIKANEKDIDKNIEEYEKTIIELNDLIANETDEDIKKNLLKSKNSVNAAIAELMKVKRAIADRKEEKETISVNKKFTIKHYLY